MNIRYNYEDQDRKIIVSLKCWDWKLREALNDLDTVKYLIESLKLRLSASKVNNDE